jgi:ribosomal protein S18 acetylase RimI-like enzyme
MSIPFQVRALASFTQAEIWPIITGYETQEIYVVEKTETDLRTVIDIRLVRLLKPYRAAFFQDFTPEECQQYASRLAQGYSFGAYQQERLIGFALGEAFPEDRLLRIWEFHVMAGFRRMGVGRALMEQAIARGSQDHLATVMLETQNTNVNAIRFYRRMGFSIDSIDLSPPHYIHAEGDEIHEVAFYMKRTLTNTL